MTEAPPFPAEPRSFDPQPAQPLSSRLEELRASVLAEGRQKGLAGKIQRALLRLLEGLVALLAALKEGAQAAPASVPARMESPAQEESADISGEPVRTVEAGPIHAKRTSVREARKPFAAPPVHHGRDQAVDDRDTADARSAAGQAGGAHAAPAPGAAIPGRRRPFGARPGHRPQSTLHRLLTPPRPPIAAMPEVRFRSI